MSVGLLSKAAAILSGARGVSDVQALYTSDVELKSEYA